MKKLIYSLLGAFILLGSFIFVACGEEVKGEINVSSDYFISDTEMQSEIAESGYTLSQEGYNLKISLNEGDSHTTTMKAKVLNAKDGRVKISNNYEGIVFAETNFNADTNESDIVLTAKSEGLATLIINSYSGSADPVSINVYVYSDLVGLAQKQDTEGSKKTQYVEVEKELSLVSSNFLVMTSREGGESNKKDISWAFGDNEGYASSITDSGLALTKDGATVATISNGQLKVEKTFAENNIILRATSKTLFTNVSLEILNTTEDEFSEITFGRESASARQKIESPISIIRNNDEAKDHEAYLSVNYNSSYDYDIAPVTYVYDVESGEYVESSDYLDITLNSEADGYKVYLVRGKKNCPPAEVLVGFNAIYKDYDKVAKSYNPALTEGKGQEIKIALSDVVDNMLITSDSGLVPDGSNFDLYQSYADNKGKYFNIQLKPDTVISSMKKYSLTVRFENELPTGSDIASYIKVMKEAEAQTLKGSGKEFALSGIDSNANLYFMAGDKLDEGQKVTVTFKSESASNIVKSITFTSVKAPTSNMEITPEDQYLATDRVNNSKEISVGIKGITSTRGLYLDYDRTLPIEVSGLTYSDGKLTFTVTNKQANLEGEIQFYVKHENGMSGTAPITLSTFIPLTGVKVTLDPTTMTGVSSYSYGADNSITMVITKGSTVKLNYNVTGRYTSLDAKDKDGKDVSTTVFKDGVLFANEDVKDAAGNVVSRTINLTFKGYNEEHEEHPIFRSFTYEIYIPVTTLRVNQPTVNLISEDSLSQEDVSKSIQHMIIDLRNDNNEVTYKDKENFYMSINDGDLLTLETLLKDKEKGKENFSFEGTTYKYTISNISISNTQIAFDIQSNTTNGYDSSSNTLNIEYRKYNTFRTAVTLNVNNATRVSEVIWENEVDSIYLDTSSKDLKEKSFVFVTSTKPADAYNSGLVYKFIPDANTDSSIVRINGGVVSISSALETGGTGYIYVLPKDAVKRRGGAEAIPYITFDGKSYSEVKWIALSDIGNNYSTLMSENTFFVAGLKENGEKNYVNFSKIIKKIRLIVADGESVATAYRIYGEAELKKINPTKHYILMNDVTLDNWDSSISLTKGSLRGYVPQGAEAKTKGAYSTISIKFTGTSNPLFTEIGENAEVSNLTFSGEVKTAFVASENKGTISNITVDVNITVVVNNTTVPSTNETTIKPSSVTDAKNAGAIVGVNSGEISGVAVFGATISGAENVGGIAGTNTGTIKDSFVELYKFKEGTSKIEGKIVGGLVGLSKRGKIESSYIYDYSLEKDAPTSKITGIDASLKAGAMIGSVGETTTSGSGGAGTQPSVISNSFAVVGLQTYTSDDTTNVKIEDAYISYYEKTSVDGVTPATYEYKSDFEEKDSEKWIKGASIVSWVNGKNAHLKFYQSRIVDVGALNLSNDIDAKFLKVEGKDKGILMLHDITAAASTLSQAERNRLDEKNRFTFSDIFGEDSEDIIVQSSDNNIVETTSNAIIIKKVTKTPIKLTISSKKDYSKSETFEFIVLNTISEFKNDVDNKLSLQVGKTASITYTIKDTIYLGSSEIYSLKQNDYSLKETTSDASPDKKIDFSITGFNGTVYAKDAGDFTLTATLSVTGLDAGSDYQKAINNKFNNTIDLTTSMGANKINVTGDQLVIYPSTTSSVGVALDTDKTDDNIDISIVKSLTDKSATTLVRSTGDDSEYKFYEGGIEKIVVKKQPLTNSEGKTKKYNLTVSISDSYKSKISEQETYYMLINSKSGTAENEGIDIAIKLNPQDINHIDMTSYLADTITNESGTVYYHRKNQISSLMSPGNYSYMVVGVDPTYSYYKYFVIGAGSNGNLLPITKMSAKDLSVTAYTIDTSSNYLYQGNDIRVIPDAGNRPEQYYFRVYASKSIKSDMIIPLTISFYNDRDELLTTTSYSYNITYQKPAGIEVNPEKNNSPILAKGGSVDIKISIGKDQELNREDIGLTGVQSGITIGEILGPFENEDGSKYFTTKVTASLDAKVNSEADGLGNFQVYARVSRFVNGIKEIEETRSTLTLVQFAISESTKDVKVNKDMYSDFNIDYVFDPVGYVDEASAEALISARNQFKLNGYYNNPNENFSINTVKTTNGIEAVDIKDRMYIIEGNNSTKVRFVENNGVWTANCGKFELKYENGKFEIVGLATTDDPVVLKIENRVFVNKNSSSYNEVNNYYNISVVVYTDEEDNLLSISSAADFLAIKENATAENYILTNDIELTDYTPFDTSKIEMLDGNGYTINITNFNMEGSGTLQRALFSTVTSNTTLKNIRVNYYYGGQIDVNVSARDGYSTIQIAGLAIENEGIITNSEVIAMPYYPSKTVSTNVNKLGLNINLYRLNTEYIISNASEIECEIAGFVINNSGSITNSRVGGDKVITLTGTSTYDSAEYTVSAVETALGTFNIIGQGTVSGFVSQNSGVITSSSANRVQITNNSSNIDLFTSGFAKSNSGRISTSFVQGAESKTGEDSTEKSLCLNGTSISSNGYIAGFVSDNTGSVDNSYANIAIKGKDSEERLSYYAAGFVYSNQGSIKLCYASCKMEDANISQSNFSGVDVKGEPLNTGTIEKSYYNAKDSNLTEDVENAMKTGATLARNPSSKTQFYGFSFASQPTSSDGIWYIAENGTPLLTLTEANNIAFSHRVATRTTDPKKQKYPYAKVSVSGDISNVSEYKYGGKNNPIIIRSAEEFDLAMGKADASTNMSMQIASNRVKGTYRIVKQLDLGELKVEDEQLNLSSTNKTFAGTLFGNGFTIKNITISVSPESNVNEPVGLFSRIDGGSIINLNLEVGNVTATNSRFVGGLAGLMTGESCLINIDVIQLTPQGTSTGASSYGVQGMNITGGLVGAVFGSTTSGQPRITNVSITDPIVQSAYYDENHSIKSDKFYDAKSTGFNYQTIRKTVVASGNIAEAMNNLSFAGGLFGYIDMFDNSTKDNYTGLLNVSDSNFTITNLKGYESVNVRAEIVGGLVGFSGLSTNIKDAGFIFSKDSINSNIISYNGAAGGLFGYTMGIIKQVYAEHEAVMQDEIENNMDAYYTGSTTVERGILNLFIESASWEIGADESIEHKPEYIGGLIGYQKYGKLISSYSKINVIAGTDGCIAGGVIGRVGNPDGIPVWFELPLASGTTQGLPTTSLINEVYASGDVRGKNGTKLTAGGIVGSVAGGAKVTFTSVNAVNYIGISEINQADYTVGTGATPEYSLSGVEIYAYVAKQEPGASVNAVIPKALAIKGNKEETTNNTSRHLAYVSNISYDGKTIEIPTSNNKDVNGSETGGIKVDGEVVTGKNNNKYPFREIIELKEITDTASGYVEMNGYFLNSGYWTTDNWTQDLTDLYPRIKFVEILDCLYLDQDNIEEVLILMNYTAKEIRVRGLDRTTNEVRPINLTDYSSLLNIRAFAGRMIGGWDENGLRATNKIGFQAIILSYEMFASVSNGVVFQDLVVKFKANSNDNSLNVTGGAFISSQVSDAKFENVTFDFSEISGTPRVNVKPIDSGDNRYAGLICPFATSTSFVDIKIVTSGVANALDDTFMQVNAATETNTASVTASVRLASQAATNGNSEKSVFAGFLAGQLTQSSKYRSIEISNILIKSVFNSNESKTLINVTNLNSNHKEVYEGLYFGQLSSNSGSAPVYLSICDVKENATRDNEARYNNLSATSSDFKGDAYIGGYIGDATVNKLTFTKSKEDNKTDYTKPTRMEITLPETTGSVYAGGMFGKLSSNTIDGAKNEFISTIKYPEIGTANSTTIAIGGLAGWVKTGSASFSLTGVKPSILPTGETNKINAKDLYLAGLFGYVKSSGAFSATIESAYEANILDSSTTAGEITAVNAYLAGGIAKIDGGEKTENSSTTTAPAGDVTIKVENKTKSPSGTQHLFKSTIQNKDGDKISITSDKDDANVYAGGVFGYAHAASIDFVAKNLDSTINIDSNKNFTAAGFGGNLDLVSRGNTANLKIELSSPFSSEEDATDIDKTSRVKSSIKYTTSGASEVSVAGLVAYLSTSNPTLTNISKIYSTIEIDSNPTTEENTIDKLNSGVLFGFVANLNTTDEISKSQALTLSGSLVIKNGTTEKTTEETDDKGKKTPVTSTVPTGIKVKEAYIGAVAGSNSGSLTIGDNLTVENFTVGSDSNPMEDISATSIFDGKNKIKPISVVTAYVGGLVGHNGKNLTIKGGNIENSTKIAVKATSNTYVGGAVGAQAGGSFTETTETTGAFTNDALFAVENTTTPNSAPTNHLGGLIGSVGTEGNTTQQIIIGSKGSPNTQKAVAVINTNFFVSAKSVVAGGIVGNIAAMQGDSYINNTAFGGAFKIYGASSHDGEHTFGGIVGSTDTGTAAVTGTVGYNVSYGDYIVTYRDSTNEADKFSNLSKFTFGGIVGYNNGLKVESNYSLTTCNNDRIATTEDEDKRQAIVGSAGGSISYVDNQNNKVEITGETFEGINNLYSHSVTLTTDDSSYTKITSKDGKEIGKNQASTDVGYLTKYDFDTLDLYRGYGSNNYNGTPTIESLVEMIKNRLPAGENDQIYGTDSTSAITARKGHKLNPITIGSTTEGNNKSDTTGSDYPATDTNATKSHLNGVTYYAFKSNNDQKIQLNSNINVGAASNCKLAIIGDTREVNYTGAATFISHEMNQNDIVSSLRLTVNINNDNETDPNVTAQGGLVTTMTGGTIYAVAVLGEMSVGGKKAINIAPVVGAMKGGFIDETMSAVNIIYRAKEGGDVAAFATFVDKNKTAYIRNSYSTGRVTTYNKAKAYAFIDGDATKDENASTDGNEAKKGDSIHVNNCYTISQIDWHDYVSSSTDELKFNFGYAIYTDCWYDLNATECNANETGDTNKPTQKETSAVSYSFGRSEATGVDTGFDKNTTGWAQSCDYNFGYATRQFGYLKQSSYATKEKDDGKDRFGDDAYKYEQKNWNESSYDVGKKNDYIIIPNAGKLAQLSNKATGKNHIFPSGTQNYNPIGADSDGRYVLTNDIELNKTQYIGKDNFGKAYGTISFPEISSFTGELDGQEHTIDYVVSDTTYGESGTYQSKTENPLFATISGEKTSVRNLRLTNVMLKNDSTSGALAEVLNGATINNIVANGFIRVDMGADNSAFGGIIGRMPRGKISNCKNYVKIDYTGAKSEVKVGGIVGCAEVDAQSNSSDIQVKTLQSSDEEDTTQYQVVIEDCYNYAPLQNNSKNAVIGGIIGKVARSIQDNLTLINNCGNMNSVIAGYTNSSGSTYYYAGGIVGYVAASTKLTNSYNTAMVKAGNKANDFPSYAGGIVGYAGEDGSNISGSQNLYNSGVIEALGKNIEAPTQYGYEYIDPNATPKIIKRKTLKGADIEVSINADSHEAKIEIKKECNVYADGIVGSTTFKDTTFNLNGITNYKSEGQVIRNGVYVKNDKSVNWYWDGGTYTEEKGFNFKFIEYTPHITGFDDLGYPTSFCVTAKRSITPSDKTDLYIVQNQTIISRTRDIREYGKNGYERYYEYSKTSSQGTEWEGMGNLFNKSKDAGNNLFKQVKINGLFYALAKNGLAFIDAIDKNLLQVKTTIVDLKIGGKSWLELNNAGYTLNIKATVIHSNNLTPRDYNNIYNSYLTNSDGKGITIVTSFYCKDKDKAGGTSFKYEITANKATIRGTIKVDANNVEINSDGKLCLFMGQEKSLINNQAYTIIIKMKDNSIKKYKSIYNESSHILTTDEQADISLSEISSIKYDNGEDRINLTYKGSSEEETLKSAGLVETISGETSYVTKGSNFVYKSYDGSKKVTLYLNASAQNNLANNHPGNIGGYSSKSLDSFKIVSDLNGKPKEENLQNVGLSEWTQEGSYWVRNGRTVLDTWQTPRDVNVKIIDDGKKYTAELTVIDTYSAGEFITIGDLKYKVYIRDKKYCIKLQGEPPSMQDYRTSSGVWALKEYSSRDYTSQYYVTFDSTNSTITIRPYINGNQIEQSVSTNNFSTIALEYTFDEKLYKLKWKGTGGTESTDGKHYGLVKTGPGDTDYYYDAKYTDPDTNKEYIGTEWITTDTSQFTHRWYYVRGTEYTFTKAEDEICIYTISDNFGHSKTVYDDSTNTETVVDISDLGLNHNDYDIKFTIKKSVIKRMDINIDNDKGNLTITVPTEISSESWNPISTVTPTIKENYLNLNKLQQEGELEIKTQGNDENGKYYEVASWEYESKTYNIKYYYNDANGESINYLMLVESENTITSSSNMFEIGEKIFYYEIKNNKVYIFSLSSSPIEGKNGNITISSTNYKYYVVDDSFYIVGTTIGGMSNSMITCDGERFMAIVRSRAVSDFNFSVDESSEKVKIPITLEGTNIFNYEIELEISGCSTEETLFEIEKVQYDTSKELSVTFNEGVKTISVNDSYQTPIGDKIVFKGKIGEAQTYNYIVEYNEYSSSKYSSSKYSPSGNGLDVPYTGIIVVGDVNLGSINQKNLSMDIYGNNYFLTYYNNNNNLFSGSGKNVKKLNLAGYTNVNIGAAKKSPDFESTNIYGTMKGDNDRGLGFKAIKSFVNFNKFNDKYTDGATTKLNNLASTNYGLIVGYDGADGVKGDNSYNSGGSGKNGKNGQAGQSFDITGITNEGIIKAGNGGNGGRGGDGNIGDDSKYTTAPYKGGSGGAGGTAGKAGTVKVGINEKGEDVFDNLKWATYKAQDGFAGNAGHTGIWIKEHVARIQGGNEDITIKRQLDISQEITFRVQYDWDSITNISLPEGCTVDGTSEGYAVWDFNTENGKTYKKYSIKLYRKPKIVLGTAILLTATEYNTDKKKYDVNYDANSGKNCEGLYIWFTNAHGTYNKPGENGYATYHYYTFLGDVSANTAYSTVNASVGKSTSDTSSSSSGGSGTTKPGGNTGGQLEIM